MRVMAPDGDRPTASPAEPHSSTATAPQNTERGIGRLSWMLRPLFEKRKAIATPLPLTFRESEVASTEMGGL